MVEIAENQIYCYGCGHVLLIGHAIYSGGGVLCPFCSSPLISDDKAKELKLV